MEQDLKKLVAWTLENGVTPDFFVSVETTVTGSRLSNDEMGERYTGSHHYRVVATTNRHHPSETLEVFQEGSVDIDSCLNKESLTRPYLEACYKALVGEDLPTGEEGSERYLAEGTYLPKGSHESDRVHWDIVRENSSKGWFVEIRFRYGTSTQVFTQRLTKKSFRESKTYPGGKYIPGFRTPIASLTKEQAEEVLDAFSW